MNIPRCRTWSPSIRRVVVPVAFMVVAVIGAMLLLPHVALPASWARGFVAGGLATSSNDDPTLSVDFSHLTWSGLNHLVLHDVALHDPSLPDVTLRAERVQVQLGLGDLLPWWEPLASRRIVMTDGLIMVRREGNATTNTAGAAMGPAEIVGNSPGAATDAGGDEISHLEGAAFVNVIDRMVRDDDLRVHHASLRWERDGWVAEEVTLRTPWGEGEADGRFGPQGVEGRLHLLADDATDLMTALGINMDPVTVRGPVNVTLDVRGLPAELDVAWHVQAPSLEWEGAGWAEGPYQLHDVTAHGRWNKTEAWVVEQLRGAVLPGDPGVLNAPWNPRAVEGTGTVTHEGHMVFHVRVDGLRLPDDVPQGRVWGMAGTGQFAGVIDGRLPDLRLHGVVELGPGTLWHQPMDRAHGTLEWADGRLTVESARVEHEGSVYYLSGQLDTVEEALALTLDTEQGRVETLLDVLGWHHLPLTGTVDGTLHFRGPLGSLESEGMLTLSNGNGWSQPFDEISSIYRWDRDHLTLQDGVFRLQGGRGEFSGRVGAGGELDLDIDAAGLPLESVEAVRRAGGDLLTGRVDFQGHVAGDLTNPQWEGRVEGRRLQIGPLDFERGGGDFSLSRGAWEVQDLVLERESGALYTAAGWVDATPNLPTLAHLVVDVRGEALEEALSMLGVRLAYPLVSGQVVGRGLLMGELDRPDGEIVLNVSDALLAGRPAGLNVELDVAGGLVRVRQLNLGSPEQQGRG